MFDNYSAELKVENLKNWMNYKASNVIGYEKEFIDSIIKIIEWKKIKGNVVSNTKEILYLPLRNSPIGVAFFYDYRSNLIDSCNLVLVRQLNNKIHDNPILGVIGYYSSFLLKIQTPMILPRLSLSILSQINFKKILDLKKEIFLDEALLHQN